MLPLHHGTTNLYREDVVGLEPTPVFTDLSFSELKVYISEFYKRPRDQLGTLTS